MTKRSEKSIDVIIDRSWDELLAVIKSGSGSDMLVQPAAAAAPAPVQSAESFDDIAEIEEVAEVEDVEEVAEAAEETEELGEIDEIEEVEELGADTELAVEDLDEAEAAETAERPVTSSSKGLLNLASKIASEHDEAGEIEELETDTEQSQPGLVTHKGLLGLASEYELAHMPAPSTTATPKHGKGLLAVASDIAEPPKGLLALASEIEFGPEYQVIEEEPEQDFIMDMKVVSPLSFMFSDLDNKDE
jgi:hypothetical protein